MEKEAKKDSFIIGERFNAKIAAPFALVGLQQYRAIPLNSQPFVF
jgi:hypothetical protein